ncbi:MAG TPA: hypothetical protein VH601_19225 [Bryobacteraceae bacterium]
MSDSIIRPLLKREIAVSNWRECRKGDSLQGFITLTLPSGMVLHDATYHQRTDGSRWIGLPGRPYRKADGTEAWTRIIDFVDKAAHKRFQEAVLGALDEHFARQS